MRWLDNMKFRDKVISILVIPLLGLCWFSGQAMVEKYQFSQEMKSLGRLSELAVRISDLVHETQKERGLTAGFLGSHGKQFRDELARQRTSCDQRLTAVRDYVKTLGNRSPSPEFTALLADSMGYLDSLTAHRNSVDSMDIPTPKAIGFYTEMNAAFLNLVAEISNQSGDPRLMRHCMAYTSFLLGKERAGIERALLNNTFAAGRFGPGIFINFVSVVAAQDTFLTQFQSQATPAQRAFYRKQINDPAVAEVKRMRELALAKGSALEGDFGVDATYWFATITKKIDLLKEAEDFISRDISRTALDLQDASQRSFWLSLILTVFTLVSALALSVWLIRRILAQLGGEPVEVMQMADTVADGDLALETDPDRPAKSIYGSLRQMVERLSHTVSGVKESAEVVATGSSQISQGNQDLSQRTQQQAAAVEETASAVEQMTSSIRQNAANAAQANDLAQKARDMAQRGGEVLSRTITAMAAVTDSSKRIREIIGVVNEIAFQTNLLALNAAVEAARAGEAGRGFAVVAGEVRNLAGRSASAAKEIQGLIADSVVKVEQGNELVAESGRLLSDIIVNVQAVADTIAEISSASQEQATGVEEVNKAVAQMDQGVQQNAALVEEAASASENMAAAADELRSQMSQFKVRGSIVS